MKKSLYIILTALLICACSEKNDITMEVRHNTPSNDPFSPAGMVYTSLAELDSIYNADSENVIYFNTARLIASAELRGCSSTIFFSIKWPLVASNSVS